MDNEQILLRPYSTPVGVFVHPHNDGDVVSVQWVDANGHRYLLALEPEAAHQIGQDLLTATTDPDIGERADHIRNRP